MSNTLTDLLGSAGVRLARLDDTDYLAIHAVYAWPSGGAPELFCLESAWHAQPVARLAELALLAEERAAEVTRLAAEVASLKAQLAARAEQPPETPVQNQAKMLEKQMASLSITTADPIVCPDCGKSGWKNTHALDVHRGRAHAPQQFIEELGWRCAVRGCSGAHARSITDPAFCTLHAQVDHANGHEIAAPRP